MKKNQPVFGSLGSNYSLGFALRLLWWYFLPPARSQVQTTLAQQLLDRFPEFSEPYFFATGRDAIQFALQHLPSAAGSKILTQAFSCAAIEEAILGAKMKPVFVDLGERSTNLDAATLQVAYEKNPTARIVLVQHVLGCPADIASIRAWCDEHNLLLIEDLAQSFGGLTTTGESLGSFGHVIVTSFGRDKILDAVAGGCCLFRRGVLQTEPERPELQERSTFQHAIYPLLTVLIRNTFSSGFGKVLQRFAQNAGIIRTPVLRTTPVLGKLSVGQAAAVLEHLKHLPQQLEHRSTITAIYARLLKEHLLFPAARMSGWSALRVPLAVSDPDGLATKLKQHHFYLTDRWYRAAVDSGSIAWNSTYHPGLCPRAETAARSVFTLPTHMRVSAASAVRLAVLLRQVLAQQAAFSVQEITDKTTWEAWIADRPEANFLQSWNWGVFQQQLGNKIIRLGLYNDGQLIGVAQGVFERARRGSYCSFPGGPLLDWDDVQAVAALFSELQKIVRAAGCSFIRFRPQLLDDVVARAVVKQLGTLHAAMHVTADRTVDIDITQSDEQLLANMRKNTRSAIRKAEKEGITTTVSDNPEDIKDFYEQQRLVAQRHKFVPFSYLFLFEQFQTFAKEQQALLISAYRGSDLLATAFVLMYHKQAVYHYGISTAENATLPGAYAVQWRVMIEAKRAGCESYNLWGVAPPGMESHRFAGVSVFKRGFGGREVQYLEAQDIPLKPTYWLTRTFELLRKRYRHL
ncbi:MAG: peptidoglycan bridge formation glycyltransferase FemA/FemB family protein [bacterium]|nr:peptidoglycan bridge formation glycyltransferase FemA/FemB family protein [bacterium]